MVPLICILHCAAVANPHLKLMSAARYHHLYGSAGVIDWTPMVYLGIVTAATVYGVITVTSAFVRLWKRTAISLDRLTA